MITAVTPLAAKADHDRRALALWRRARSSQPAWAERRVRERLAAVRRTRRLLARHATELAAAIGHPQRRSAAETISAEILPLADACRFLERRAAGLLRPRKLSGWGPVWLGGSRLQERREPLGVVLVIGPGNYPLFLPGVQALQALVAGNAVLWKPAVGGAAVADELRSLMRRAGLPHGLLSVLPEDNEAARAVLAAGVDKVLFTGSADTGRAVLADLAPHLTPATMELSGCDAVFVRHDADLELTARALIFGLTLNGGATCMAPRRVFVAAELLSGLEEELARRAARLPAVSLSERSAWWATAVVREAIEKGAHWIEGSLPQGGRMQPVVLSNATPDMALFSADLMAPVLALCAVRDDQEALAAAARCPYALAAAIFSRSGGGALAERVNAGVVVVNDLIAPTADPRLAFGGRGESGFGLTRGAAGLLELTRLKTVLTRRTALRPHLRPPGADDERVLRGLLRVLHGGPGQWLAGWRELTAANRKQRETMEKGSRATGPENAAEEGVAK